jgi:hypothetical protein
MRPEQRVIVKWMQRQLQRLQWKPERWAKEARLAPTTVTRAMAENYDSVSSVTTLHALARAASVPSILDFLAGQEKIALRYPIITVMLGELLPAVGCQLSDDLLRAVAEALAQALTGMIHQEPNASRDPEVARLLARAAKAAMLEGRE